MCHAHPCAHARARTHTHTRARAERDRRTDRQTGQDRETEGQRERPTDRPRQTDGQIDRHTDRQTDRQTEHNTPERRTGSVQHRARNQHGPWGQWAWAVQAWRELLQAGGCPQAGASGQTAQKPQTCSKGGRSPSCPASESSQKPT